MHGRFNITNLENTIDLHKGNNLTWLVSKFITTNALLVLVQSCIQKKSIKHWHLFCVLVPFFFFKKSTCSKLFLVYKWGFFSRIKYPTKFFTCTHTMCQNGAYLEQFQGKKCIYTCLAKNPLLNFVLNHSMMKHKQRAW